MIRRPRDSQLSGEHPEPGLGQARPAEHPGGWRGLDSAWTRAWRLQDTFEPGIGSLPETDTLAAAVARLTYQGGGSKGQAAHEKASPPGK